MRARSFGSQECRFNTRPVAVYRELWACLHAVLDLAPVNSPNRLPVSRSHQATTTAEYLVLIGGAAVVGRFSGLREHGTNHPKLLATTVLTVAHYA